jgi:hypothetical protein
VFSPLVAALVSVTFVISGVNPVAQFYFFVLIGIGIGVVTEYVMQQRKKLLEEKKTMLPSFSNQH